MSSFQNTNWLIEHCIICGSINHIFLSDYSIDAWECYNCFSKWWLNDCGKDNIMIQYDVDAEEADNMLINCDERINFTFGQCGAHNEG